MEPAKIRVAVIGATGYAGAEVVRLLANHPLAEVVIATSERAAGRTLGQECPWLASDLVLQAPDPEGMEADVAFLCQESGFALQHAPRIADRMRVVDLSADFRLRDPEAFERTYGRPHTGSGNHNPVYGLSEWVSADELRATDLVANPGCYPTATLLALLPIVRAGLLGGTPVIDAKSGVSGAGRARKEVDYLFSEVHGGFKAYAPVTHRHVPEIEQMAGLPIRFTPHLVPMPRGLQATLHIPLARATEQDELHALYDQSYAQQPFVRRVESIPSTKQVVGSNRCDLFVTVDSRTQMAVVFSVIDNLVKGAAGQAIQNMNLMMGWDQATGLPIHGVWP
ncbi:MAG: N-acetyl-gamma-glutamyl-phosphate reductase [Fimbriimonas sp.]